MVFGTFWFLGACSPPTPWIWGALQPGCFLTPNHKTACYGCMFEAFFGHKSCNLSCCKFASKPNSDFMKKAQNHANCEVKPNFGKKQLEPKCGQIAFYMVFHSQVTLCMFYIKKVTFLLKAIKHCKNALKTPFLEPQALQTITLKRIFHSRPQEKET